MTPQGIAAGEDQCGGHSNAYYRRQIAERDQTIAELRTALARQVAYNGVLANRNHQLSRELLDIGAQVVEASPASAPAPVQFVEMVRAAAAQ